MNWDDLLGTVSVAALALLAGGLLIILVGAVPTFRTLSDRTWVQVHTGLDRDIKRYMPQVTALALLTGIAAMAFPQSGVELVLRGLAVVTLLAGIVITVRVNHPVNVAVGAGAPEPAPELPALRARWIVGHRARTLTSVAALLFAAAALGWG